MSFRAATRISLRRPAFRANNFNNNRLSALRLFHSTPSNMTVHSIPTKKDFEEAVKTHSTVFVDAYATWCGPCKAISPLIAKMSEEERFKDVFFAKIDVDDLPDVSQELGITAMPTFVLFKDGKQVEEKVIGAIPREIEAFLVKQL
ncbi:thioredoxin-like protein [Xylaria intraflava]|nr:thioredoxin-like protein [Xylaria intraflava]